jgi:hypothetical protein
MKFLTLASVVLFFLSILIFLQFLQYGFLPSINPKEIDKAKVALEVIFETNSYLIIETLICLFVMYFLNKEILAQSKFSKTSVRKINLLILLTFFLLVISSMCLFSINYYSAVVR